MLLAAAGALAVALAGCTLDAERDGAGAVAAPDDVAGEGLRNGDCLLTPPDDVSTEQVAISCEEPHDGEVFHLVELPAGPFPGAAQLRAVGERECLAQFAAFVGTDFEDSALGLLPLTPVQQGWDAGDRSVRCIVSDQAGGLTTSLRGAGR